jgi:phospholipase C
MRFFPRGVAVSLVVLIAGLAIGSPGYPADPSSRTSTPIKHFIFLMQGDRTFDNYFGTYPGADGITSADCQLRVLGSPQSGCVRPFALHGKAPQQLAAGKSVVDAQIDGGKMDGFVAAYGKQGRDGTAAMGYYDDRDLPFHWSVADRYALFDRFFSSAPHGYRTNRSFWVSAAPPPGGTEHVPAGGYADQPTIFDRLQSAGVSWKFYVENYQPNDTFRAVSASNPASQTSRVPLLNYPRFVDDPALRAHIVDLSEYYRDLVDGTLPAVAYVASSGASERSARSMAAGQDLVRCMLNQLAMSRFWSSSAMLWSYDGSGGWYDHVTPPTFGNAPAGLRVPALLVSAYARRGQVNHTTLDYTSALRFIEQNWGLPYLTARDATAGNLTSAFDFKGKPRRPEILPVAVAAAHTPLVPMKIIYWFYGGAAALGLLLMAFAVGLSARPAPSPAAPSPATRSSSRTTEVSV